MQDRIYPRPQRRLLLAEAPRTLAELARLSISAPFLYSLPRGDGHPVLVLPGFGAGDGSTTVLRGYLDSMGYRTHAWELGRNLGPAMENLAPRLAERLDQVSAESGDRQVSIVGWSLGGVYARLLAQLFSGRVRQVITLGSPFNGSPRSTPVYPLIEQLIGRPIEQIPLNQLRLLAGEPLRVPSTAIYSKTDAIVPWQIASQPTSNIAENIEVFTGHLGLGFSPSVLYAIADRLRQKEDNWRPFQRSPWMQVYYGPAILEETSSAVA